MPDSSKTELPTEKKLQEAIAEGNFAKTPDIQIIFVLLAALSAVSFYGREETTRVAEIAIGIFGGLARYPLTVPSVLGMILPGSILMMGFVLPICITCGSAGILAGGLQSRFRLTPKAIDFKLGRLNPLQGFKRIFSGQSSVKLATDSAKVSLIGTILWQALKHILSDPIFYTPVSPDRLGTFIGESFGTLLGRCVMSLGGIAALNFLYQMRRVQSELKMTKQEVKDENKQAEGDPRIRGLRRQMARRMLQKQMLKAVPTADVVITNPTHFAIALKYQRGTDKAPVILAKGENLFARRIKEIAAENEVPMFENKPVARMLFKYGKVGKPIPAELYRAVAEILAFVYKTNRYYFHQLRARREEQAVQ